MVATKGRAQEFFLRRLAPTLLDSLTAEELAGGKTRFSVHPNVLSLKNKFNFYHRLEAGKGSGDTITISGNIPIDFDLNYFLTLNSELKWKWCIPYPSLKKFESGFDGKLDFAPQLKEQAIYETIFSYFITKRKANLPDSEKPGLEGNLPLSVVKMSEMERVAQATANALQSIRATLCGQYPDLTGMIHYGSLWANTPNTTKTSSSSSGMTPS